MSDPIQAVVTNPTYQATGTIRPVLTDELGGAFFSQLSPDFYGLSKSGKLFYAVHTVATAVVPLQVVPTTTAAFVVNNISTDGKLVVPVMAGLFLGSGTSGIGATLFAQVGSTALATQLVADTAGVTRGNGRGGADQSYAYVGLSKTVAGAWTPIGSYDNAAAAVPGQGFGVRLDGMFTVRSTYAFGLHAVAGAGTTAAFCFWAIWAEVQGVAP